MSPSDPQVSDPPNRRTRCTRANQTHEPLIKGETLLTNPQQLSIAIIGGTGALGSGLALRWAHAGHRIVVGSRTEERAQEAVATMRATLAARGVDPETIIAKDNVAAAAVADICVLTVPYDHQLATLTAIGPHLSGKILIDVTVPLRPPKVGTVQLPSLGSAGQEAQNHLGEDVHVVSAFQNVAAHHLQGEGNIDCDVLVCGNSKEARETVVALVAQCGLRGFSAGPIANAAAAEALTSVLITLNRQFKSHTGIRITGTEPSD